MSGRSRKNSIKELFSEALTPAPEIKAQLTAGNPEPVEPKSATGDMPVQRAASGAIKAMGLSLSAITREAEEARNLRQALGEGERVVALATDTVDSSFISDRLSEEDRDDPDFLALVDSLKESGQHAPILVRPHPASAGRYQVAYGHRRLKAARRLGQPVKAIVRSLSDDELVLAQGKENAERRNLTFIERALFARTLVERGFDRKIAGEALSVQKSELSRLLQVAESVPENVVRAIGPAPKAGRDRWMALGQLFSNDAARVKANDEIFSEHFRKAGSDERFQMLFDRLARRQAEPKAEAEALSGPDGKVFAKLRRQGRGVRIDFAGSVDETFLEGFAMRLKEEYARFVEAAKG